ncbi:DUF6907 domain-containing protein [Microbacterium sp.]|uniref:DUF6907 domain-containing protein n=1 Tax=Microbacterium sp. TaxID=51671 RepID=UPI0039E2949E
MEQGNNDQQDSNRDDCPPWCVADHGAQDHVDDRWHESEGDCVPVVELRIVSGSGMLHHLVVAEEFDVRLEQRVGQVEVFILFGIGDDRERNFRLSLESTRRIVGALERMLRLEAAGGGMRMNRGDC